MSSLLNESFLLIGFPEYREPAQRLARAAGIPYADALVHHFPDGETRLRLPEAIPGSVVLCQTLDHPNSRLIELVLAAATAREGSELVALFKIERTEETFIHRTFDAGRSEPVENRSKY